MKVYGGKRKLPVPLQQVITAMLVRARDPEAEVSHTRPQKAEEIQTQTWGWLPVLTLSSTLGILSVAHAYTSARLAIPGAEFFFWLGLLVIFVPATVRLLSPAASRFERIGLLCVVGICFYLVKVMYSPLSFSGFDEFLHWRTAVDIGDSGHLFSDNVLLPVSPFYPGLEIVTDALSKLSGLSIFTAGIIVVGVMRVGLILAFFILYELITKSARLAGIATILYMTNPNFLFFDAQFAYESLALPLAIIVLVVIMRGEILSRERGWITPLAAGIVLAAVVVTHHVTDLVLDGILILWAVISVFQWPTALRHSNLAKLALIGVFMSVAWISLKDNPVVQYLSSPFTDALNELEHILTGSLGARQLFVNYSGQGTPLWERIMEICSVALISLSLPFGLLCLWQRYRHNALACTLGLVSLLYPFSLVFRFANVGTDISSRSAAFLFIAISCVVAIFITQFWPTQRLNWKQTSLLSCAMAVVLVGSIILGNGPSRELLPGPYVAAADDQSFDPEGIQTAIWARSYFGPNNRMETDRANQLLMSTYGEQRMVTSQEDHIDMTAVFFSSSLGDYEVFMLQQAQVRYLVVDLRLSRALPLTGYYFEEGEPGTFQHTTPIDRTVLTKFSTIPQINRVFDSGDIVIYDVRGLSNASSSFKKP